MSWFGGGRDIAPCLRSEQEVFMARTREFAEGYIRSKNRPVYRLL